MRTTPEFWVTVLNSAHAAQFSKSFRKEAKNLGLTGQTLQPYAHVAHDMAKHLHAHTHTQREKGWEKRRERHRERKRGGGRERERERQRERERTPEALNIGHESDLI